MSTQHDDRGEGHQQAQYHAESQFRGINRGVQIGQEINYGTKDHIKAVKDWLSPINSYQKQADVFTKAQTGTGQWFLKHEVFESWTTDGRQVLWCHGPPGSGKTVLLSIVVDYLRRMHMDSDGIPVACVYCDYKQSDLQNPMNIFASLCRQLCDSETNISKEIQTLYARHQRFETRATFKEVVSVLKFQMRRHHSLFILVDALDEISEEGRAHSIVVETLQDLVTTGTVHGSKIRLMLTSRRSNCPFSVLDCKSFEIQAAEEDITQLISSRIDNGISYHREISSIVRNDRKIQQEVVDRLVEMSDGMFLMAELYLRQLASQTTRSGLRKSLRKLPQGQEKIYDETWERIRNQDSDSFTLAKNVLRWLTFAFRQLTVDELLHALAVRPGDETLDPTRLEQPEIILKCCIGLVVVDKRSNVVRLVHYTTHKYFDSNQSRFFPDAHTKLTLTCLDYLSLRAFAKPCRFMDDTPEDLRNVRGAVRKNRIMCLRLGRNPFLFYAALYWGSHARGDPERLIQKRIFTFLSCPGKLCSSVTAYYCVMPGWMPVFRGPHALFETLHWQTKNLDVQIYNIMHVLVLFGLAETLNKHFAAMTSAKVEINSEALTKCLFLAANMCQSHICQILLDAGAEMSFKNSLILGSNTIIAHKFGQIETLDVSKTTLLRDIDQNNQPAISKCIIEAEDQTRRANRSTLILWYAVLLGKQDLVTRAISSGADPHASIPDIGTPLFVAATEGHSAIAEILLKHGADPNATNTQGQTALFAAADGGGSTMVKLLLSNGGSIMSRDYRGQDALGVALTSRHVFKRRQRWMEIYKRDPYDIASYEEKQRSNEQSRFMSSVLEEVERGELPRILFEDEEQQRVIQKLIEHGADLDATTHDGETVLHSAVVRITRLEQLWCDLPDTYDINVRDNRDRTPLLHAMAAGNIRSCRFLVNHGAYKLAVDSFGATALHLAVHSSSCLAFALELGIDVNTTDNYMRTPLHYMRLRGEIVTKPLLLKAGADENMKDKHGWTASEVQRESFEECDYDWMRRMREWSEVQEEARLEEHETWLKEGEGGSQRSDDKNPLPQQCYLVSDDEESEAEDENHAEEEGRAAEEPFTEEVIEAKEKAPARGAPCPCKSGHKYKKCCGMDVS